MSKCHKGKKDLNLGPFPRMTKKRDHLGLNRQKEKIKEIISFENGIFDGLESVFQKKDIERICILIFNIKLLRTNLFSLC